MKLECDWLVLCEQTILDRATGHLTLVNCFESVVALSFPSNHPRFSFAARFHAEDEDDAAHTVGYRFVRHSEADGEELIAELGGGWSGGTKFGRVYLNFQVLRLKRPETVWFRIDHRLDEQDWQRGPSVPVLVTELSPEKQAAIAAQIESMRATP